MLSVWVAIGVGVVSSLATALAMVLLPRGTPSAKPHATDVIADQREDDVVFLFNGGTLIDATAAARSQLPREPANADDLARLVIVFCQRFEGLEERLENFLPGDRFEISEVPDDPDSLRLVAENRGGHIRIAVTDPLRDSRSEVVAHYSLAALRAELFTLRSIAERSPIPTWKRRHDGTIIWANSNYMALASSLAGADSLIGWPPPDLFQNVTPPTDPDQPPPQLRVSLARGEQDLLWFDLIALPGEIETLYFALPVDKLVRAENSLKEFVQTLTKTFAHLRIGLAIFDQKRRLALFNPALVDLTGLPPEQLTARPTLHAFLDALRDAQRIPEPKDYKSWRMQIAQLEAGAADGTFEETWHLSSGKTYRVSGRPHPDGAVAYLFEDISSEVSMTRSFRSEIEMSQAVVDNLDTAIAAFSQFGYMTMSNRAYAALWELPAKLSPTESGIVEASQTWRNRCKDGPDWDALRDTVLRSTGRQSWTGIVELLDGTALRCDLRPIAGGVTLVTFTATDTRVSFVSADAPALTDATDAVPLPKASRAIAS